MIGLVSVGCDPVPVPVRIDKPFSGLAALVDGEAAWGNAHDRASRDQLLARIAFYLDIPLLPPVDASRATGRRLLLVPGETLVQDADTAWIDDAAILGGVVPFAFVATKAITHGLVTDDAARPHGWSLAMADHMGDAALTGYSAFNLTDAAWAGRLLLTAGPVRIKDVGGKAGLGQSVVRNDHELDAVLAREDPVALARNGIVLEQNLADVVTYSVGSVQLGGECISYWGSQNLTTDHAGREVYAGTDLLAVRGGFEALHALDLPPALRRAIACAATFDQAAHIAYPGIRVTRRNYDVIEGTTACGARRIGVLEQSWRVGGASGAEIAAFEALRAEPETTSVRCSTVELYDRVTPPVGATIYYQADDPVVGAMTKYAMRLA